MSNCRFRCLLHSASEIVQVTNDPNVAWLRGPSMKNVKVLRKAEGEGARNGYSLIVDSEGKIAAVGEDSEVSQIYRDAQFDAVLDCTGKTLIPGLVDAHSHPVWAGDRVQEFAMKLAGATYMDIHQAGGGIHFTVQKTREASEQELFTSFKSRAQMMKECGTTVLEAKSGYGLDLENEMKMLRVLEKAKEELKWIEISGTFCGAHAIPRGCESAECATNDVIETQIAGLKKERDAGRLSVLENIDAFCEKGVFDVSQTEKILESGRRELGLAINFHGDELSPTGSAELGAKMGARGVSHLEEISENGIKALSECNTVAVVLPTTAYILRLKPPPVREMIDSGVIVGLGSDFNPNAYCYSMPLVMHLGCVLFRMSMEEAMVAATLNAAASLGRGRTHGALQVGRVGDILVIDAPRWEHLIYQFGAHSSLIKAVLKEGFFV